MTSRMVDYRADKIMGYVNTHHGRDLTMASQASMGGDLCLLLAG